VNMSPPLEDSATLAAWAAVRWSPTVVELVHGTGVEQRSSLLIVPTFFMCVGPMMESCNLSDIMEKR
jgi:hypothetical protein